MKAERIVVDSNVLISALLLPGSKPHQVLEQLAVKNMALLFSDNTFTELVTRLTKPKFDQYRTPEQLEAFLDWLSELGEWVVPNLSVNACRDSDDNKFLSLALAGEADCLISGDKDLLVLHPFENIPILSPGDFLSTFD
ncbi:MAG: putative toxin-antitoxin system toxin component, PIN family [Pseudomonadales bacterium]|nr:putative toxin-antitoxin system toxin component, PIN family [Pseudomonadales bacterium]